MGNLFARSATDRDILNALEPATPASTPQSPKTSAYSSSINAYFAKNTTPIEQMTEQDVCKWLTAINLADKLNESVRLLGITGLHLKQRPMSNRLVSMIRTLNEVDREKFNMELKNLMAPKPLKPLPVLRTMRQKEELAVQEKLLLRYTKARVHKQPEQLLKEARALADLDRIKETLLKLDKQDIRAIDQRGWRIKLVITELSHTPLPKKQRDFRSHASTILNLISLAPTFGIFHSALIVGNFYLHWNDSDLVIPRSQDFMSAAAYFACDITTVELTAEDGLDRVARVVCHWNRYKKYHNLHANCHHFVEALVAALGVDLNEFIKNSAIGDYVGRLKTTGSCDLRFRVSDDLLAKVGDWLKEQGWLHEDKYVIFETHKQLDDFYRKVEEVDRDYFIVGRGVQDRALLKSFDRGFWLRYFHIESRAEHTTNQEALDRERQKYEHHRCPFGNPRDSSFR